MRASSGRLEAPHLVHDALELADVARDDLAAFEGQLAGDEIDRLDAVGAFVDRQMRASR